MPQADKKRSVYEETQTIVDMHTGEVTQITNTSIKLQDKEPDFVKIYLDCILSFKDLSKSLNPILIETLKYMSYANSPDGGQMIFLNSAIKKRIASALNLKIDRVNKAIKDFKDSGIFKHTERGAYQVNPIIFGKGDWKDIKKIRATFDFNTGNLEADLEFKELDEEIN